MLEVLEHGLEIGFVIFLFIVGIECIITWHQGFLEQERMVYQAWHMERFLTEEGM